MFDGITRKEWERWESAERCFRAHPKFYRFKLAMLFAEGVVVGLLLFAVIALLVALCIMHQLDNTRIIAFLVINLFVTARVYYTIVTQRPWSGLPELREQDWPPAELSAEKAEWRFDFKDWIFNSPEESVAPAWIADQLRRIEVDA